MRSEQKVSFNQDSSQLKETFIRRAGNPVSAATCAPSAQLRLT